MALDVDIRVDPTGAVFHRRFTRFTEGVRDLSPAFEEMADEFYGWMDEAFTTRGASSGSPWAPLSPGYAAWKATRHPGKTLLVRSENLRRSLTGATAPGAVRTITDRRLELGTDVPYAGYHQTGTSRMPSRPIIRLTDANKTSWTKIIQRHLLTVAGRLRGELR